MSGNRTVGDALLKMECDNRRMLRSLMDIKMETAKITGNPTSTNCPNCGAPITGPFCEYCGTIFDSDYSHKLEFTSEEVNYINAMMRIANLTASEARRLRGI